MGEQIKNMEYWKGRNSLPGIKGLESSGLTMAAPGSSPNKGWLSNIGKAFTTGAGALFGKRKRDKALSQGGDWKGSPEQMMQATQTALSGVSGTSGGNIAMMPTGGVGGGGIQEIVAQKIDEKVDEKVEEAVGGEDSAMVMKSPIKKKGYTISNKYGVGNVLEGEFGPFNQQVALEDTGQEQAVEEVAKEPKYIAGQYLVKGEEEGTYYDEEKDATYSDPEGIVSVDEEGYVVDLDYEYEVDENNVIIGIKEMENFDEVD